MGHRGDLVPEWNLGGAAVAMVGLTEASHQKQPRSLMAAIPPQLTPNTWQEAMQAYLPSSDSATVYG